MQFDYEGLMGNISENLIDEWTLSVEMPQRLAYSCSQLPSFDPFS